MAKITLADGMVIEGTIEELKQMGVKFPVEEEAQIEPLKVGDYVKALTCSKYVNVRKNDICIVEGIGESGYIVVVPLRDRKMNGLFELSGLVKATAEEIVNAKLAEIGRKPNEFKIGDAVRYKKAFTIVTGVSTDGIVTINQSNHISKNIEVSAEDLTLVFPAEARFE
jgi:hypothetical protein